MSKTRSKSKAKTAKPRAKAGRKNWSAGRRNTLPSNGSLPESASTAPEPEETVTVGEAIRRAVEELGEVVVDPSLAPTQMLALGGCYEEIARRQAAYDAKAEAMKTAKKSLEVAQAFLLTRVREFTHPAPLPLFDMPQAEGERQDMPDAIGGDATGKSDGEGDEA